MNKAVIDKYNKIKLMKQGSDSLKIDRGCPYNTDPDPCGSWCPHFYIEFYDTTEGDEIQITLCCDRCIAYRDIILSEDLKKELEVLKNEAINDNVIGE